MEKTAMWALLFVAAFAGQAVGQFQYQYLYNGKPAPVAQFYVYGNQMVAQPVPSDQQSADLACSGVGYFTHPTTCGRFYRCVDFTGEGTVFSTYEFVCPSGTVFVTGKNTCIPGGCAGGVSAVLPSPQVKPSSDSEPVHAGSQTEWGDASTGWGGSQQGAPVTQPATVSEQPSVTYPPEVVPIGDAASQPGAVVGSQPGTADSQPGAVVGSQPGAVVGSQPGAVVGSQPGTADSQPGAVVVSQPGAVVGSQPGAVVGSQTDTGSEQPSVTYPPEVVPIGGTGSQPGGTGTPGGVGSQPGAIGSQPSAVGSQPGAVDSQPGAVGSQPGAAGSQPVTYPPNVVPIPGEQPVTIDEQGTQPDVGESAGTQPGGGSAVQPGGVGLQPVPVTGGATDDVFVQPGVGYPQPGGGAVEEVVDGNVGGADAFSCTSSYQQDSMYCNIYHSCPDDGKRYLCSQNSIFNEDQQLCDLNNRETLCAGKSFQNEMSIRRSNNIILSGFYPFGSKIATRFGVSPQTTNTLYQYQQPIQSSFVYNRQPLTYTNNNAVNPFFYYTPLAG